MEPTAQRIEQPLHYVEELFDISFSDLGSLASLIGLFVSIFAVVIATIISRRQTQQSPYPAAAGWRNVLATWGYRW